MGMVTFRSNRFQLLTVANSLRGCEQSEGNKLIRNECGASTSSSRTYDASGDIGSTVLGVVSHLQTPQLNELSAPASEAILTRRGSSILRREILSLSQEVMVLYL